MKSSRLLLALAAVAVAVLIVGLFFALRSPAQADRVVAAPEPAAPSAPTRVVPSAPQAAPAPAPTALVGDAGKPAIARPTPIAPTETINDAGQRVRDHRGEGASGPPSPLLNVSVATVRQLLDQPVKACAAALTQRPDPPVQVDVSATIRSAAGHMRARDVTVGGAESLGPDYAACVARAFNDFTADAPADQPEGEDLVHMPFTVP